MDITELLELTVKYKASDLHLSAGVPPMIRIDGDLKKISDEPLAHPDILKCIHQLLNDQQKKDYQDQVDIDFAFDAPNLARFRVNVFHQSRGAAAAFRVIPAGVLSLDEPTLPSVLKDIASYPSGLVLITGPTGCGKSTTLSAMIDYINTYQHKHIITIEDPIETIHTSKQSLINQREVQHHTNSFSGALRSCLREDPDVILVGELRDLETIRLAVTAAETGHLVFATLHTQSATKTINRIIDAFPGDEKSMIRSVLSETLQAVIAQVLLKKIGGGRIAAFEIMLCNTAIRHLIREDKIAQIYSSMQMGQSQGINTLDQHLTKLMNDQFISQSVAQSVAMNKNLFH